MSMEDKLDEVAVNLIELAGQRDEWEERYLNLLEEYDELEQELAICQAALDEAKK